MQSPSARKVWIEIILQIVGESDIDCHLPRGRCGLKSVFIFVSAFFNRHLPRGRCGLKYLQCISQAWKILSPSARKVWIEMNPSRGAYQQTRSPSARKVWIEIYVLTLNCANLLSPSARKVWIEIGTLFWKSVIQPSPSARKVWIEILPPPIYILFQSVTFREEGVD